MLLCEHNLFLLSMDLCNLFLFWCRKREVCARILCECVRDKNISELESLCWVFLVSLYSSNISASCFLSHKGEILPELVSLTTAREVWIALENIPAPSMFSDDGAGSAGIESESSDEAEEGRWGEKKERERRRLLSYVDKKVEVIGSVSPRLHSFRNPPLSRDDIYATPGSPISLPPHYQERRYEERARIASQYLPLYKAILNGDWATDSIFLPGIRGAITLESETALMVAVRSSGRNHIVTNLIEVMTEEEVAQRDITGETALFKAVQSGNYEAAVLLVDKNRELPSIMVEELFAVHWAATIGHREMVVYLLGKTAVGNDPSPFEGPTGLRLLDCLAYGGLYDNALDFLQRYPKLASMEPSALQTMVHQHSSFYSGTRLNLVESLIYSCIPVTLEGNANRPVGTDVENPSEGVVSPWSYLNQRLNATFWDVAEKLVRPIKSVRETKLMHHQALKFVKHLCEEAVKSEHFSRAIDVLSGPMVDAATVGTCEIVEEILESFPIGIQRRNIKGQNIFHAAIENRHENVFNLIYQVEKNQRGVFLLRTDKSGNNALHMAGNLGRMQQLSLRASVACPALQMQRELQWFKAVEELFENSKVNTRNNMRRTPQELFTGTHKDLVEKGEKWMKDTATSCTIVAALIVTVVFAAAITVPGGNNGNSGLPIFLGNRVFVLFGVSDSLALFSATTSLLTFLSILTSRYGEQDFLYSLPKKLIIGLFTLFLSIIAMMVTFGAALKIVFGHKRAWITISGFALSCVPVALFAWLQFPLLVRMIKSTYFPGIFKKRSKPIFY